MEDYTNTRFKEVRVVPIVTLKIWRIVLMTSLKI